LTSEEVKLLKSLGEYGKLIRRIHDYEYYNRNKQKIVLLLKPNLSFKCQWKLLGLGFRKGKLRWYNKGKYIRFYKNLN